MGANVFLSARQSQNAPLVQQTLVRQSSRQWKCLQRELVSRKSCRTAAVFANGKPHVHPKDKDMML